MTEPQPTRAAGEDRMQAFAPRMGTRYAKRRNADHGPGAHSDVSCLSPYFRRRLVWSARPSRWRWSITGRRAPRSSSRR